MWRGRRGGSYRRMHMALGALIAIIDFHGVPDDEYHDWYDMEHLPERERIEGFLTASRWISRDDPKVSLGFYDLSSVEVLDEAGYQAVGGENFSPWSKRILAKAAGLERYEVEQIAPGDQVSPDGAGGLYVVTINVEEAAEDEFNRWYAEEHLPALAEVPGVMAARRFRSRVGPCKYLAIYHVEDPAIPGSAPWLEAAETPWTHAMRERMTDREKRVFVPYSRAT